MRQNNPLSAGTATTHLLSTLSSYNLPNNFASNDPSKLLNFQSPNPQFSKPNMDNHISQQMQAQPLQQPVQMSHQQKGVYNTGSVNNGVSVVPNQLSCQNQSTDFPQSQLRNHLLRNQQEQSYMYSVQQTLSQTPQQLQMQQQSSKPSPSQQLQLQLLQKLQKQQQQSLPPNQQPLGHGNNSFSASTFMQQPPQIQQQQTFSLPSLKVQKRGPVIRSIDVTRYSGYEEQRNDLARIEFVNCVQNIKILSSVEVQQMSLDGDLAAIIPTTNQACSETDSVNAWKVH
ncbi:hypothetical protein N665_0039s0116 [Sinapis alba]|nr:hypothetical protein N665_0039s0116 [Sinapis alba]